MSFLKSKEFWSHLTATILPILAVALVPVLQASGNPLALAGAMILTNLAAFYHGSATGQAKAVAAAVVVPAAPVDSAPKAP